MHIYIYTRESHRLALLCWRATHTAVLACVAAAAVLPCVRRCRCRAAVSSCCRKLAYPADTNRTSVLACCRCCAVIAPLCLHAAAAALSCSL